MPDSVEDAIVAPLHQASRVGWNDDAAALLLELFSQGGRVVSAVADHVGVADFRHRLSAGRTPSDEAAPLAKGPMASRARPSGTWYEGPVNSIFHVLRAVVLALFGVRVALVAENLV